LSRRPVRPAQSILRTTAVRAIAVRAIAVLAGLAFLGAAAQEKPASPPPPKDTPPGPRSPTGKPSAASPAAPGATGHPGAPALVRGGDGPIIAESVDARESIPLSARESLRLAPGEAGRPAHIAWGEDGEKGVPLDGLTFLRFPGPGAVRRAPVSIFLRSGSELSGSMTSSPQGTDPKSDDVRFICPVLREEPYRVPLDALRGIIVNASLGDGALRRASSAVERESSRVRLVQELLRRRPERDEVIFLEGDRGQGIIDAVEGNGVRFTSPALGEVRMGFDKVRAILLADIGEGGAKDGRKDSAPPAPGAAPAPAPGDVSVLLADGSALRGTLSAWSAGVIKVAEETLGNVELPIAQVVEIGFLGGKARYLSDLAPVRTKEGFPPSFSTPPFTYQMDASVLAGPLRMQGREYRKGIGVHSYSLLEFELPPGYKKLQATLGLDESARPTGSVVTGTEAFVIFRVRLDGKLLLEQPQGWRDPPFALDVPIEGGKVLALEVDCGKADDAVSIFNYSLDRADWAEARLVK